MLDKMAISAPKIITRKIRPVSFARIVTIEFFMVILLFSVYYFFI